MRRMIGKIARLIVLIVVCAVASGTLTVHAQPAFDREYLIKAAFLYNFVKFIEWPAEVLSEASPMITICVLGEDPFGVALDSIKEKIVKSRNLAIRRFEGLQDLAACHVLFISLSEKTRLAQVVQTFKDRSILTVSEVPGFAERGGIINFTIEKNNVRFEINVDSAERARLKISSQLLKVAKVVREAH